MKTIIFFFVVLIGLMNVNAQTPTLSEKLGYPPDARLLIVHADDAGASHSTNEAVIEAFEQGGINSTAIMVPCPWFPEIAGYARKNPDKDFGLHLTFSSEWHTYKWGGVAPASEIKSILTSEGYFYATTGEAVEGALVSEVETELRAQIEKALDAGIIPSHFDTHMNTLLGNVDLLKLYLRLGREYQVPVMIWNDFSATPDSFLIPEVLEYPAVNVYSPTTDVDPANWNAYYSRVLSELPAGISVLIVHLAVDNAETRAMTEGHDYFDAEWRQRDLDYILSKKFKKSLKSNNIQLITWGDIKEVMYPE